MAGNENSGRKPKIEVDDELIEDIAQAVRAGNFIKTACEYVGIDESTYYRYMKLGKQDVEDNKDTIYSKFYKTLKKARATAETRNVAVINQASEESWQASAWWLERSFPDRWGKRKMDVNANLTGDLHHQHEGELTEVKEYDKETKELLTKLFRKEREQKLGDDEQNK